MNYDWNYRICGLFAIASLILLMVSTLLATLGHCVRGHKMLLASGLYALGGKKPIFLHNFHILSKYLKTLLDDCIILYLRGVYCQCKGKKELLATWTRLDIWWRFSASVTVNHLTVENFSVCTAEADLWQCTHSGKLYDLKSSAVVAQAKTFRLTQSLQNGKVQTWK